MQREINETGSSASEHPTWRMKAKAAIKARMTKQEAEAERARKQAEMQAEPNAVSNGSKAAKLWP